ncbi:MAG: glycine cleavage system aminomethyltransferase GcvT [Parachlamydiaceae bacterium]
MKTALYEHHRALGAKLIDFGGWQMPVQYKGIVEEHLAVRRHVGIFDVSHMGRIIVEGLGAEALLDYLSTNQIAGKKDGTATYTVWSTESGTCVDDLIIYRESPTRFFLVVNASNRDKDLKHLLHYSVTRDVIINDRFKEDGIIALQGPDAIPLISSLFPQVRTLKPMTFISRDYGGEQVIISHTGYTGAGGVEIYASNQTIVTLWESLLERGEKFDIQPIGLGARDTLRLEMGYALYGHELTDSIAPVETVSAWTIKWDKSDFLGKQALEALMKSKKLRHEYGILLMDKGVIREGYPVFQEGKLIGTVTSGTYSPSLQQSIGIVLVEKNLRAGDSLDVQIRQNLHPARVVNLPFIGTVGH